MNDRELNELLQRTLVPERSEHEWKEFADDTVRRLNSTPTENIKAGRVAPRPTWRFVATWTFAGATACALFVFALNHWREGRIEPRHEIADAQKLFSELSALFPNQLEAVLIDGATPRLVLAEQISPDKGTPLFVRLCGAQGCQRVITFSGQRVSLNGESCEVLVDARGHVIVTGERFVWSSADAAARSGGYRIEAATLSGAL